MDEIYQRVKTPYKHGPVIKSEAYLTDSPSVFRFKGKWYMYYIMIHKDMQTSGYETHLASSSNLVEWKYEDVLFRREDCGWDSRQIAAYAAFVDNDFGRSNEIMRVNDRYYAAYLGGALDGYETDPLSIGMAYADSPTGNFTKFREPILTPFDKDARELETITLYKSNMFVDEKAVTGYKYVNAYNAKAEDKRERIYLAVSEDGEHWKRFLDKPVIDGTEDNSDICISGDPQIVKIDDLYVMFFFRYEKGKGAYNTFACSENLRDWTVWRGKPLIESEYEWENVYAHKSCVVEHEGVVYHYYCAVNKKGERFIALATSEKLKK